MYRPVLDAVSGSLALTALVAMLPLLTLFVLLGVLRMAAWKAALISLVISLLVAIVAYAMPVGQALMATTEGAAFGFFPILWIVINAIWIYNMTVVTGHFDVLRRSFAKISDDQRIQAVIVAFCFGALLEALAGFGTPVAITSVMLIALGFKPIKAAVVALVANTAPVAFGALAVPITTLATVTGLPEQELASIVGRQTPLLAFFVPMALVFVIDRWKGVRATLPATLTCGITFAVAQFVCANFVSTQLTDIVASPWARRLSCWCCVCGIRPPATSRRRKRVLSARKLSGHPPALAGARVGGSGSSSDSSSSGQGTVSTGQGTGLAAELAARDKGHHDTRAEVLKAYAPYLIIIAVFSLAALVTPLKDSPGLCHGEVPVAGPGSAERVRQTLEALPTFTFNWLASGAPSWSSPGCSRSRSSVSPRPRRSGRTSARTSSSSSRSSRSWRSLDWRTS